MNHSNTFSLIALFYLSTPSWLKVIGWVGWWWGGGPCDYCVSPVQRIGFWGFSDFVRTFGSGLGTVGTGDSDLDLGLTIHFNLPGCILIDIFWAVSLLHPLRPFSAHDH